MMQINNRSELDCAVRINGVLPDIHTLGDEEKSERAAEVKRLGMNANTSCSVFLLKHGNNKSYKTDASGNTSSIISTTGREDIAQTTTFHLLVDVGNGVVNSLHNVKGLSDLSFSDSKPHDATKLSLDAIYATSTETRTTTELSKPLYLPDALLITHAHDDHIHDLPLLLEKVQQSSNKTVLEIFCTSPCREEIFAKFPDIAKTAYDGDAHSKVSFNVIEPNKSFNVGAFSVTPIEAYHGENSPPGSVIYILKLQDKTKIIIGWDFLSLKHADESILWNPSLAILGAQSFNQHPETGLISVTESFNLVRAWNAKQCYLVHYRGLSDFEDAKNQWFRGPAKPMTSDELQKTIDSYLKITGNDGKFKITVAREGMIWTDKHDEISSGWEELESQNQNENQRPIENLQGGDDNNVLELEGLEKYIMRLEKDSKADMVYLMIEDKINRYDLRFVRPHKELRTNDTNGEDYILEAEGEKGMLAKGPALHMETRQTRLNDSANQEAFVVGIRAYKGKKDVFNDDIVIDKIDAMKLNEFIKVKF
jgi:glyoxylase-like metal-dependent hydrolase (beta-lactamase superfamily II)